MLRTITIGTHVSIQGIFVQTLRDGRILVKVGENLFQGKPVDSTRARGEQRLKVN